MQSQGIIQTNQNKRFREIKKTQNASFQRQLFCPKTPPNPLKSITKAVCRQKSQSPKQTAPNCDHLKKRDQQ